MKKILVILGIFTLGLALVGCTGQDETATPPSLVSIMVNEEAPLTDGVFKLFYQAKSETVVVKVTLNNPENLEITSIVINGNNYRSHNFINNSSRSVMYFELNTGSQLGEKTWTINEIVYKDGDDSESVRDFTVNEKFKTYVYKEVPTVVRENYTLYRESISVDFKITDSDSVVNEGTLKAQLFAGETLVEEKILTDGVITVEFNELLANKQYEVKVKGTYDLDDTNGTLTNVILYSGSFTTLANGIPSATIRNIVVTSNKVVFDIDFTDNDNVVIPGGLSVGIFQGDTLVDEISISGSVTGVGFEDLLNDNVYELKVLGDYDLGDGLGVQENSVLMIHSFSTLPREVPNPEILQLVIQENQIDFDIFIPENNIIHEDTIIAKIYVEGEDDPIKTAPVVNNHVDFQINNVFANFEFTIVLEADYDLNNGEGVKNDVIFSQVYSTQLNARPFVNVGVILVEQGYVTVEADVTDDNNTLTAALRMVLFENNVEVDSVLFDEETGNVVFRYPVESENIYNVEIYADYNLRDGEGVLYNQLLYRSILISHERKAPTAELKNVVITTSTIDLDIDVLDADGTIEAGTTVAYLYLGGALVAQEALTVGTNNVSFDTLLSNNNYVIIVKTDYEYDLKVGSQILVNQPLAESDILTEEKSLPGYAIDNVDTDSTSIEFDVDILDPSTVVAWGSVRADLYHEDVLVDTVPLIVGGNFNISFTGLLSDSSYEVVFVLDYDLADGNGLIDDFAVGTEVFTTQTNSLPTASILDSTVTENSIKFDILVLDNSDVIIGNTKAVLYEGDTPTGDELPLTVGVNTDITFNGVFSDTRYYVHIVTDYNMKDGKPDELAYEMFFVGYTTSSFVMMEAIFGEVIETTKDTITFDVEIIDEDGVSTNNLQAVLYKDGIATGHTIPLVVGDNTAVSFTGLESETSYKIQIESDYDLNLPSGEELAHVLAIDYADTSKLVAPDVIFTNVSPDYDSFKLDIVVENPDDTITGGVRNAVLYKDNVATGQVVALIDGINLDVEFTGLLSNNAYEVRIIVNYDLNDADGEQVGAEIGTILVSTWEKFIPVVNMSELEISRDYVSFYLNYSGDDNVLVADSLIATLYVGGVAGPSKSIETGNVTFNISGLIADFDFEIVITGDYDLDDGAGLEDDGEMYRQELTTIANNLPSAELGNVTFKQNSIDISIEIIDVDSVLNGNLDAILYDETGAVVETIALVVGTNDVSFNHTATNNVLYTIIVEADYNLLDGSGNNIDSEIAETIAIEYNLLKPEAVISNVVVGQDTITFDVDVYDNNGVINGAITAALYKDGVATGATVVLAVGPNSESFGSLLTNNGYEIRIITSYDNGDGNDTYANQILADTEQTTLPKVEPATVVVVDEVLVTSIEFDIEIIDDDSTGANYDANLYDDQGTLIGTQALLFGDNLNVLFTGLLGNESYTLKVETTYNLLDGAGVQSGVATEVVNTTLTANAPTSTINSSAFEQDSITVNLELVDNSGVTSARTARIYKGGILQESIAVTVAASQDILFDELTPNTEYEVRVYATYDLNDGDGVQTDVLLTSNTYSTKSLILISEEVIDKRINSLIVTVDDPNTIITSTLITATLYEGVTPIATYVVSQDIPTVIDMINVYSGYDYSLEFSLTYNVGVGAVAGVVYTHEFTTLELVAPVIEIESIDLITMTPIEVDVTIAEDLDTMYSGIKAELWQDGILVDTQTGLLHNQLNTVTFTGYDGTDGSAYTIIIVATVDRNDGETPVEEDIASKTWINAGH